jgi:hydrophobic/amphiphilic exporter-1 (mainly G- bacteria), HAE1 family
VRGHAAASLAVPQLPNEVSRAGISVRKKSAALLQVVNIYSPKNTNDAIYLSNYATINVIDFATSATSATLPTMQ